MLLNKPAMLVETPGTIALATAEIGRFTMFMVSLSGTLQPGGTNLSVRASASVTENFNSSIRDLRDEDKWVWILGDDHVWQPDCLMKLLKAMDENPEIDVIVPLVSKRNPPWHAVIFHEGEETEDGIPGWKPYSWSEIPPVGVFEIEAAGSAGMVIKREVIDEMGDPWFESSGGVFLNEDVYFCQKARKLGFRIFACADSTMGHLGIYNVRPMKRETGEWGALTEFSSAEEQFRHLFMPDVEVYPEVTSGR